MNDIASLIASLGFPIVVCVFCFWFIKYTIDEHRAEIQRITESHHEEIKQLTEKHESESTAWVQAINNNTLVIQKLIDTLENRENREAHNNDERAD